jgi:hypothetical protein
VELVTSEAKLRSLIPAIQELRRRCNQHDDVTTDPNYFIATSAQTDKNVAAIVFGPKSRLEACVYVTEHSRLGTGLGLWRGGSPAGDGLVIGHEPDRLQYLNLAIQFLLSRWRTFAIGLSVKAELNDCLKLMGPENDYRLFRAQSANRRLLLKPTYEATLASMGPRTRRSLAAKRRKLEQTTQVRFLPSLEPALALEALLALQSSSQPRRSRDYYYARFCLLRDNADFFSMAIRLPAGEWLSILTGWRQNLTTYVDFQVNNRYFKKESLSAVMRAFLLEHEINLKQQEIDFVGGPSLLLRKYCHAVEPLTYMLLMRPCVRASLLQHLIPHTKPDSLYRRVRTEREPQSLSPGHI